ncbi:hypothetical protein BSKO_10312 [Bryopsis sp. KO-2023]|nr:hypothetical protein BSKO_10312 [Bryopsis sp. KO-2023]
MSMFSPTRSQTSRLLANEGLTLPRQAGIRKGPISASPLARKTSYLRAKKDDNSDKSAKSEVVADEPAVVVEDTVTVGAKGFGSAKKTGGAKEKVVEAVEAVGEETAEAVTEAKEAVVKETENAKDNIVAAVEETAETMEEKVEAVDETAQAVVEDAVKAVEETVEPVAEKPVEPVAEKPVEPVVEETVEPVVEETAEPVAEATESIAETNGTPKETTETTEPIEYTYTGPEPQRFAVAEGQTGQILGAALNPTFRLFSGGFAKGFSAGLQKADKDSYSVARAIGQQVNETSQVSEFMRPSQPLEIYEYEGCPFCKKVREAVSILDLDVIYYPCPRNGPTFRPKAIELGGKRSFPYMVDPGAGKAMYESDDIINYLFQEYGDGEVPVGLRLGVFTTLSCGLSLVGRLGKGSSYRAAKMPEKPIIFWAYEASPFCKVVREVLCELEIPHLMKTVARGSPKRQDLYEIAGGFQVPYIQDPNTGIAMFESTAIIDYLNETYAA